MIDRVRGRNTLEGLVIDPIEGVFPGAIVSEDGAIVAVRLRGRPWPAVLADMVEGVVTTNQLVAPHADRLRAELWEVVGVRRPSERLSESAAPAARVA